MERLQRLPRLGVGISGEYNSHVKGIDAFCLKEAHPELIHFYEYGCDIDRGLDEHVRRWAGSGLPTTYHFLDLNLEELEDLDSRWLSRTGKMAREIGAAWLCGDAGRWHFGSRDRGHQMLMPPILCRESALVTAENIRRVEAETGFLLLPENPPAVVYLGDMHLLDYFALVSEEAGCGLLLDCAHLAIFQHSRGLDPLTALDGYPLDRVVEVHVAGGVYTHTNGYSYIEDNHSPEPVEDCWKILEYVLKRAVNLKAIVYECEWNSVEEVVENFTRLNSLFPKEVA